MAHCKARCKPGCCACYASQGNVEFKGGTHLFVRLLSGLLIALTTVYGYVSSQRAIAAALNNAVSDSSGGSHRSTDEGDRLLGGVMGRSAPMNKALSVSMTTLVEHRDLEGGSRD